MTDRPDHGRPENRSELYPILGVMTGAALGVSAGVVVGMLRDNVPLWIGTGLAVGVGIGLLLAAIASSRLQ